MYNVIGTKEKQATPEAAFVFQVPNSEQTVCEADRKALKERVCERRHQPKKNKRRRRRHLFFG
jgi:hypothetical protein